MDAAGSGLRMTDGPNGDAAAHGGDERLLREFGDHAVDVLWIVDAATGQLSYLSPAFERIWARPRDTVLADIGRWQTFVHPDDRARVAVAMPTLLAGAPLTIEYRIVRPDGAVRWIRDVGFVIRDAAGAIARVAGIAQDFTERRAAEEAARASEQQQKLLLVELQHRVRNTLAVVRSVARRTGDTSGSVEDFAAHLDGRLSAFARAQAVVIRDPLGDIDLQTLVEDELVALAARPGERVRVGGPDVRLPPRAAELLTLAAHELGTNSVKYGALLHDGSIAVTWEVAGDTLVFDWREQVAGAVAGGDAGAGGGDPDYRGFGGELLERTVAYELDAAVDYRIDRDQVHYQARIPIPRRSQE